MSTCISGAARSDQVFLAKQTAGTAIGESSEGWSHGCGLFSSNEKTCPLQEGPALGVNGRGIPSIIGLSTTKEDSTEIAVVSGNSWNISDGGTKDFWESKPDRSGHPHALGRSGSACGVGRWEIDGKWWERVGFFSGACIRLASEWLQ